MGLRRIQISKACQPNTFQSKRKRDFNATGSSRLLLAMIEEEIDFETFVSQGEHELK